MAQLSAIHEDPCRGLATPPDGLFKEFTEFM